jgi:multidrug efflux pump subunit AcrB
MSISTLSIKRPILAIVINLIILLFGIIGYTYLGVREFPSIDAATISVRTNYSGANADIIESQITEPLEKAINSIDGIRNISSSSNQGVSIISIEFKLEKDLEEAANDVRDKVSQAIRSLPQDIDGPPVVAKEDSDGFPIISMTMQSNKRNVLELSDYAENVITPRLQTIPGVSSVQIWGQRKYAMRLWLNPNRLAALGLTVLDVRNALNTQNVELPSGKLTGKSTELTVKTVGNLSTETDFNQIIIKSEGDKIIRLQDVGKASLEAENLETRLSDEGLTMVGMGIIPQPGSNYLDISKAFYEEYERFQKDLPEDFKLNIAIDSTTFIKKAVLEVAETLLIALLLVTLVIYFFFRDWAIAFRPLIDIPVSLIATFFIMYISPSMYLPFWPSFWQLVWW